MNFKKVLFGLASVTSLAIMAACNNEDQAAEAEKLSMVTFESETMVYSGQEVVLEAKNIPDGYRAEYTNNKGTEKGKYQANCKIYNKKNKVVKELNAILTIDVEPSKEFDDFCDEFFLEYLADDTSAWNVFTIDSSAFGYVVPDDYVPTWYYYEAYTKEDWKEISEYYKEYKDELLAFDTKTLSYAQEYSYDTMYSILDSGTRYYNAEEKYDPLMEIDYIDQFGGYVADFCDTVENYNFYTKQDITNLIALTISTSEAFPTYVNFVKDKYDAGYAYSEYTINEMCSYLNDIINDGDEFYLYNLIENKINSSEFLKADEKASLYSDFATALRNNFYESVVMLNTELSALVGTYTTTTEGYFANYGDDAKALYKYMLEKRLGYNDMNVEEYIKTLDKWLNESNAKINEVVSTYRNWANTPANSKAASEFLKYVNGKSYLTSLRTPDDMIAYLKEFAKTIVYELDSNPEIGFKYMDDSVAQRTQTVAYYRKSALDSDLKESITLNGNLLKKDYDDMLLTIAHEGYPGHLYEYVHCKELGLSNLTTIATNTGHGEGWAMYVEICLIDYIKSAQTTNAAKLYCDYLKYNQMYGYYLNARLDAAINYECWSLDEVTKYFELHDLNVEAAEGFYKRLIEMPTVYASYGYGLGLVYHLHQDAKEKLGESYDEKEFNKNFMSRGWCRLEALEELTEEYVNDVLFINKKSE